MPVLRSEGTAEEKSGRPHGGLLQWMGAVLAVDPFGLAVGVVLFFPDGQARLDLVDDVAAGIEGGGAVG